MSNIITNIWDDTPFEELPPLLDYNLITDTDSYKPAHPVLYPSRMDYMSTYSESRGGKWKYTMAFGLQMLMMEYLTRRVTPQMIEEAEWRLPYHGVPFYKDGWERIVRNHDGFLPVEIEAVPEGLVIPGQNVLVQYTNTAPGFGWLLGHIETMTLRGTWYPVTVATLSWHIKQTMRKFLEETTDHDAATIESILDFMLHDFGYRGVSSRESGGIGGVSHMVNFRGTDTQRGLDYAYKYYGDSMAGQSIPASEHSVHISWGPENGNEFESYNNFANQYLDGKNIAAACVMDSYDLMRAIDWWGTRLKKKVVESGTRLVVRPDSGVPTEIVPAVIKRLMGHFGYETNSKGYDTLPPYIRVIQGDGVNEDSIREILQVLKDDGLSAENVVFGMGGKLLQGANRDTLKFAQKPSAVKDQNAREWRGVYKDPITDPGKMSKQGRLALVYEHDTFRTIQKEDLGNRQNILQPVYRNGKILHYHNFNRIRERSNLCLAA